MFDLITGRATHIPQRPMLPMVISTTVQVLLLAVAVTVPLLFITERVPQLPTMMAFVAAPPPPPPPPPPAPAPARPRQSAAAKPVPTTGSQSAPLAAPSHIAPEPPAAAVDDGVPGGVEGGIPGGVVGGIVGGLPTEIAPPPAPPQPPPPPRRPIRVGGQIETPALLHRVEPTYPDLAVRARIQGVVILEAVVDEQGRVKEASVLRPAHPVLDREALAAVRQWRYRPLQLNGIPVTFVLTVTLSFTLQGGETSE